MFLVVRNFKMWASNKQSGRFGFWWFISHIIAPFFMITACVGLLVVAWSGHLDFDMNEATKDAKYWLDSGIPDEALRLTYVFDFNVFRSP